MKTIRTLLPLALLFLSFESNAETAEAVLRAAGVQGGLVVVVGCDDPELITDLGSRDGYLVHALDTAPGKVAEARSAIRAAGSYGKVSAAVWDGKRLPYVDNLVNLLVVSGGTKGLAIDEMGRALAPRGVVVVPGSVPRVTYRKPVPPEIDEWTHFGHGPDNNSVAEDTVVGPPRHAQWLAGPDWTRHHDVDKRGGPALRPTLSAGGRLFYLIDETRSSDMTKPSAWVLHARDGFSGVTLWKKPLPDIKAVANLNELWRGMVVDSEAVYLALATGKPLSALEAGNGKVLRSYEGTGAFREVIREGNNLLVLGQGGHLMAFDAAAGKRQWQWTPAAGEEIVPLTLAASDGSVFLRTHRRVCCFSGEAGDLLWEHALPGPAVKRPIGSSTHEKLLVKDGVVLVSYAGKDPNILKKDAGIYKGSHSAIHQYGGKLAALSAKDGEVLWETVYLPNIDDRKPGEIYVIDGTVWFGPGFSEPRDLRTGEVKGTRDVLDRLWTDGHHYRCYPGKATTRFAITAKRGMELFDLEGDQHSRNNWVRSTCALGVTPCNGLIYNPPHSCGCYMEAQLYGFYALAGERDTPPGPQPEERLEKGPAYGKAHDATSTGWATYRGNNARGGSTTATVPTSMNPAWSAKLGGRLSAPSISGGKVFLSQVDAHTVHAFELAEGKKAWAFTAGGRVDSPPTVCGDRVLFGSRDGYVYCLRAADGELAWRFLAAPRREHLVAHDRVESVWPVHGSVLVENGVAYVAAGRSSYLDGGIALYGLDPATGKILSQRTVRNEHVGALDPPADAAKMDQKISQNWLDYKTFLAADKSDSFSMAGARVDVLSAEGGSVFMRHLGFNEKLEPSREKGQHLFSTSSLLDDTRHNRSYWILGTADFARLPVSYPWIVKGRRQGWTAMAVPYGRLLAFDASTVWTVHRQQNKRDVSAYTLVTLPRPAPSSPRAKQPDFRVPGKNAKGLPVTWQAKLSMEPTAILGAGNAVLVAGAPPAATGASEGLLEVFTLDGELKTRWNLSAPPTWDGLAAAEGRLVATLANGTVVCYGE